MSQQQSITGDEDAFKLALGELQYFSANAISVELVRKRVRDSQHPAAKLTSGPLKTFCNKVIRELKALDTQLEPDQSPSSVSHTNVGPDDR
ncbi:hypothetical protein ACJQWK_07104 [Exserohilum turcicum]